MVETRAQRILLVEDSLVVRRALENALRKAGYEVVTASTAREAVKEATVQRPDLMILDLTLETETFDTFCDGFAVLNWLRHTLGEESFNVIIHTADASPLVDERARASRVFAVIRKGDKAKDILDVVRQALEQPSPVGVEDSEQAGTPS